MSEAARRYLRALARAQASQQAAPETSYYPALEQLLNGVGNGLTPAVTAVINIRDQGAGIPDGGLFAAHQLRRSGAQPWMQTMSQAATTLGPGAQSYRIAEPLIQLCIARPDDAK